MCATFTEDDIGKTVVNANGEEIGMISAIERGRARVDPDPGLTDTIKAALGWEDTSGNTYALQENAVESITDDVVHLAGDSSMPGGTTDDADTRAVDDRIDRDEDAGQREMGGGGTSGSGDLQDVETGDRGAEMAGTDTGTGGGVEMGADEREMGTDVESGTEPELEPESTTDTESETQFGAEPGTGTGTDLEESGTEPGAGTREAKGEGTRAQEQDRDRDPETSMGGTGEERADIPGPTGEMDREPKVEPLDEDDAEMNQHGEHDPEHEEEMGHEADVDPKTVTDEDTRSGPHPDEDVGDRTETESDSGIYDAPEQAADRERDRDEEDDAT